MKNINCIIIHGCPGDEEKAMNVETRTYDKHWIPWLKEKLVENKINVSTPQMPEPWKPDYEKFKKELEKYDVSENTILIGHSCGCAFLVRYLGETKKQIPKLILVAPWKLPYRNDGADKTFYEYDIDKSIVSRVKEIIMFTSNDEEEDGKKSLKIFHNALGGKIIEFPNHGHYTLGDMKTNEFPKLLNEIIL